MQLDGLYRAVDNDGSCACFIRGQAPLADCCPYGRDGGEKILRSIYRRHADVDRLALAHRPDAVEYHSQTGHIAVLSQFHDFLNKLLGLPLRQLFDDLSDLVL